MALLPKQKKPSGRLNYDDIEEQVRQEAANQISSAKTFRERRSLQQRMYNDDGDLSGEYVRQETERRFTAAARRKYDAKYGKSAPGSYAPYDPGNPKKPPRFRGPRKEYGGDEGGYSIQKNYNVPRDEEWEYEEKKRQEILTEQRRFDNNARRSTTFESGRARKTTAFLGDSTRQDEGNVASPFKSQVRKLGGKTLLGSDDKLGG